jgi:exopolysaccharide biosynthesis polyprenyl glycosylphosphotransferase
MGKLAHEIADAHGGVADALTNGGGVRLATDGGREATTGGVIRRYRRIGFELIASDAACITAALIVSYSLTFGLRPMPMDYTLVALTAPLVWGGVFHAFGLYTPHHLSASEIFRRTIGAASVGVVLLAMESLWTRSTLSRPWFVATWLIALFLELAVRRAWAWRLGRMRRDGRLSFRTLIIGADREAGRLAHAIARAGSGFTSIGFVDVTKPPGSSDALPVLGRLEDLGSLIGRSRAECLFVASTAIDAEAMRRVTQAARQAGVEVRVSANLPQILTSRLSVQQVGHTMALSLKPVRLSGGEALTKRGFDLALAGLAVLVTLPLYGLIAAAIRLTSPGPILFRQERVTRGGRPFTMYKFRTMAPDADRLLAERAIDPTTPFFKLADDPRLTRLGRLLRRSSLDELPQLLNVIKGDMSLVGPRPLPVDQVAANMELLWDRHEVPAGLTGWWQINGRSGISAEDAINFDIFYIENWSLALDLYILFKTVGTILGQRGAV